MEQSLGSTLNSGFRDLITSGEMNVKSMGLNFVGMMANSAMGAAASGLSSAIMSGIGGMFSGGTAAANGAVFKGGFKAFANGGIVSKPTLGLIGEGKSNEAIVPLPDGRSIPVIGDTGKKLTNNTNNFEINVTVNSDGEATSETSGDNGGMEAKQAESLGILMTQAIQTELVIQQRPGGILSEY